MWIDQIRKFTTDELEDMNIFFYGSEHVKTRDRRVLVHDIRYGKKRFIFYMLDKQSYKCLRKIYREPLIGLNDKIYDPAQLLKMDFIEEVKFSTKSKRKCYQISREAAPIVEKLYRARHYDPLIKEFHRFDEIMFGLMHTYGMLELHQCVELLNAYGYDTDPRRLSACLRWRYALKEVMQIFTITVRSREITYIMMKDLTYPKCLRTHKVRNDRNLFVEETIVRKRADRYYAMEQIEFQELMKKMQTKLSRNFTIGTMKRLIDAFQYEICDFPHEIMLNRVFGEEEIGPYLTLAKESLINVYHTYQEETV